MMNINLARSIIKEIKALPPEGNKLTNAIEVIHLMVDMGWYYSISNKASFRIPASNSEKDVEFWIYRGEELIWDRDYIRDNPEEVDFKTIICDTALSVLDKLEAYENEEKVKPSTSEVFW